MLYLVVHSAQRPETLFKRQYFNSDGVIYVLRRIDLYVTIRRVKSDCKKEKKLVKTLPRPIEILS